MLRRQTASLLLALGLVGSGQAAPVTERWLESNPAVLAGGAQSELVSVGTDGRLRYQLDPDGNRVVDFSHAGYRGGGVAIPDVPVVRTLEPAASGDDSERIQAAIDEASRLPLGDDGFRGAVLLRRGRYVVTRTLYLRHSGVVVRGEGAGFGGTWIYHRVIDPIPDLSPSQYIHWPQPERGMVPTFLSHGGPVESEPVATITSPLVPAGSDRFQVDTTAGLSVGDEVLVVCRHTPAWLETLGLTAHWKPDELALRFPRTVTAIDPARREVAVNAPVTSRIDTANGYATGEVRRVVKDGRVRQIGVEDILFLSGYDRSKTGKNDYFIDEHHPNYVFRFHNARDGWLRRCVGFFYSCGMVSTGGSQHLTIEDCAMLDGVSTDTPVNHVGTRKYYFNARGDHLLFQRCYARYARHAYIGNGPSGGCVFLDCYSERDHLPNEWHQRWGHGYLFDNMATDAPLSIMGINNHGHGQKSAFALLWNCLVDNRRVWERDLQVNAQPGLFWNYAVGVVHRGSGRSGADDRDHAIGQVGWIESPERFVTPRSVYLAQLRERLGEEAVAAVATAAQRDGPAGAVWRERVREFGGFPEWPDPEAAPWPGRADWIAQF